MRMKPRVTMIAALLAMAAIVAKSDGPKDNVPTTGRPIPPPGITVSPEDRQALEEGLGRLQKAIDGLASSRDAYVRELLPDVRIYHKAVHDALTHQEFFVAKD